MFLNHIKCIDLQYNMVKVFYVLITVDEYAW
jgi:hypothetical protein